MTARSFIQYRLAFIQVHIGYTSVMMCTWYRTGTVALELMGGMGDFPGGGRRQAVLLLRYHVYAISTQDLFIFVVPGAFYSSSKMLNRTT